MPRGVLVDPKAKVAQEYYAGVVGDGTRKQPMQLIEQTGVSGSELNRATPILARLARLMRDCDMTLAEINPLARLEDGSFVALDAHLEMENEGRPRQRALLAELE